MVEIIPHFDDSELRCKCGCGQLQTDKDFLNKLSKLRELCGFPLTVTSYFRCCNHPEEASKAVPGWHNKGMAIDIVKPQGIRGYLLLKNAIKVGFTGIGVAKTFIHLDTRDTPAVWGY